MRDSNIEPAAFRLPAGALPTELRRRTCRLMPYSSSGLMIKQLVFWALWYVSCLIFTAIHIDKTFFYRVLICFSFGYGFVSYEKPEDAAKAIEQLNGQAIQHKKIKVAYSQPSGSQTKNINLHVSGLPLDATEDAVRAVFAAYGKFYFRNKWICLR